MELSGGCAVALHDQRERDDAEREQPQQCGDGACPHGSAKRELGNAEGLTHRKKKKTDHFPSPRRKGASANFSTSRFRSFETT